MSILAIDTATEACSAALWHEGVVHHRFELAPRRHADLILPMVDAVLEEAGTDRHGIEWIAFGRGPGAFTGVRIAAGVAHGLSLGLGCGLYPVSTLAAMAMSAHEEQGAETILTALDARMGEVYWGAWRIREGVPEGVVQERVCPPEQVKVALNIETATAIGAGWGVYGEALTRALSGRPAVVLPDKFPDAKYMLGIAMAEQARGAPLLTPAQAQPVYLRDRVAEPARTRPGGS
ncbi:tRNA (adenosine(37)-N6)-threonylcarbamoyltransferase complex dimerization subunit type 1 TsaB [Natronospira bacteriovora]|uniref:tRNA threonylcarbamoyladenosine biosynthesis protein TsaB n=1 Tax=Natronospira bacteriovora TaxID=3069753 RepID=A0ABU0W5R9_9GAMM|nr:tRNA (adenosine(37)-N6)-threonylcarbamoyltransferase complex dimerization subunit type 1 TsaB [Natronospira sp. AB-CW4]MDQ2068370.1 tRNA (adenosine(37)-N6)-threonylcarbamoyltransferase complex dimerization subunit type 1 TsaB [Natronospira sp. AB-CW4]